MSCPDPQKCPGCSDRMIHQLRRKNNESASAYLQHLRDDRPHTFTVCDNDLSEHGSGWIYKRETKIARYCEVKKRGDHVQSTTREVLQLQQQMLLRAANLRTVHPQSGVFVIYGDPPFTSAYCVWVDPYGYPVAPWDGSGPRWAGYVMLPRELTGEDLRIFEMGEVFPDGPQS